MMIGAGATARLFKWFAAKRMELALAVRVTVAAGLTFVAVKLVDLSQSSWAVITSIIVMQASLGGSVKAAMDRMAGTLLGALWGAAVSVVMPHHEGNVALGLAVLMAVAPMAVASALRPSFRVAPITALIVLIPAGGTLLPPYAYAAERVAEIALGIIVGVGVALFVLPARAQGALAAAAARVADLNAELLLALTGSLIDGKGRPELAGINKRIRAGLRQIDAAVEETVRERSAHLSAAIDPEPMARTLYRVRHDLVIIARVCVRALPERVAPTLTEPLEAMRDATVGLLRGIAEALRRGYLGPDAVGFDTSLTAYVAAMDKLRAAGVLRELKSEEVGRLYALRFGFEQLGQDIKDLVERSSDLARE
ncbi:FUSC family protein [Labrys sp. KB_33_2]|uniref:FUSC family protein n=1 Tax=Labrys sp. KB_33_2 TaxID=3237479 RepID=UPI003F8E6535